jgi:D-3-phosphoglycerate dehydrogenase
MRPGIRIINVARGGLIHEEALIKGLLQGRIAAAALDVFEIEPLPSTSEFRNLDQCILGSHNASNGLEAVEKTSKVALQLMHDFLEGVR